MSSKRRIRCRTEHRICSGKFGFDTQEQARTEARRLRYTHREGEELQKLAGRTLVEYHCRRCGKWHNGHKVIRRKITE